MKFTSYLFFIFLGILGTLPSFAQDMPVRFIDSILWTQIANQLERSPSPDSYNFISTLVDSYNIKNEDSLFKVYDDIFDKLGHKINSGAAIFVAEKMVKIAHQQKNMLKEARAYTQVALQYDAIGKFELLNSNIDKAIQLYEKIGKKDEILLIKLNLVDRKPESADRSLMFAELETLLREIIELGDKNLAQKAYVNSLRIAIGDSNIIYIQKYVNELELFLSENPHISKTNAPLIYLSLGKGWAAFYKNELTAAEKFFKQALYYCEVAPSRWLEVNTLQCLSMVEVKRKNIPSAKAFLDKAEAKAIAMRSDDLLMVNFDLKAKIAKAEGDYKAAFFYVEKKLGHEKAFNDRSKGFSLEKYYLQKEKEQLGAESAIREKEKKAYLFFIFLIAIIALGSVIGFVKQRKGKIQLFKKNELIEKQAVQLLILDTAKSNFFANISHELRTPLSLILGPINTILNHNVLPPDYANILTIAKQSAKQLEVMVKDILDLRKLELDKMKVISEPTPLHLFFHTHLTQFESFAHYRSIQFHHSVEIDTSIVADIDRDKNRQILFNLLSNAFKFSPQYGEVNVKVSLNENNLQLQVSDTGYGIHVEDIPYIFECFFRSERKGSKTIGGTGIGLSICSEFASLMNGRLTVVSKLGSGTVFNYWLPVTPIFTTSEKIEPIDPIEDPALIIQSLRVVPAPGNNGMNGNSKKAKPVLLIVEDNQGLQQYLKLILSATYHVLTAENGKDALQILNYKKENISIDLVVSDLMMPVMDGYELLQKIKTSENTRHIPVIMLTARANTDDKLKALRIGVDDYLVKPFEEEELLARICNLLQNQQNRAMAATAEPIIQDDHLKVSGADLEWLQNFETYIAQNLSRESISVPFISGEFSMSVSTLLRQLKRVTGMTPAQYLQEMRLNEARRLLENQTYRSVNEVADKVGYSDTRTFSRNFKSRFGKLPSELL